MALDLFLLSQVHGSATDPAVANLLRGFREAVTRAGLGDVLNHQIAYASRLAGSLSPLSYEEMHKVFSLCDEIHALQALGYELPDDAAPRLETTLRHRFTMQRREARLVAEDKAKEWNRALWWYADNLANDRE
jgi:hypothetical protein